MAYRYPVQNEVFETLTFIENGAECEPEQSAYLTSTLTLSARLHELAKKSELAAQSSYFLALKAQGSLNSLKLALRK